MAVGELVNIPLQAVIWFLHIDLPVSAVNLMGYTLLSALLAQGGLYWLLKARQLADGRARPGGETVYRTLRRINVTALGGGLAFAGIAVLRDPGARSWPGLLFALFATVEHINYFHLQLGSAADLRRLLGGQLRSSHLAKDLRRA